MSELIDTRLRTDGALMEGGAILRRTLRERDEVSEELHRVVLKAKREGMGVSEMARLAGVSRPTIYAWLSED